MTKLKPALLLIWSYYRTDTYTEALKETFFLHLKWINSIICNLHLKVDYLKIVIRLQLEKHYCQLPAGPLILSSIFWNNTLVVTTTFYKIKMSVQYHWKNSYHEAGLFCLHMFTFWSLRYAMSVGETIIDLKCLLISVLP